MVIDGHTIPTTMDNRGDYTFPEAEIVHRSGRGVGVASPVRTLTWKYAYMTSTEVTFWNTTVLGGAASKLCTGTNQLNDPTKGGALTTFSSCVVDRLQFEGNPVGGYYRDVTLTIRNIIE